MLVMVKRISQQSSVRAAECCDMFQLGSSWSRMKQVGACDSPCCNDSEDVVVLLVAGSASG